MLNEELWLWLGRTGGLCRVGGESEVIEVLGNYVAAKTGGQRNVRAIFGTRPSHITQFQMPMLTAMISLHKAAKKGGSGWVGGGGERGGMRRKRHQTRSKIINRLSAEHQVK